MTYIIRFLIGVMIYMFTYRLLQPSNFNKTLTAFDLLTNQLVYIVDIFDNTIRFLTFGFIYSQMSLKILKWKSIFLMNQNNKQNKKNNL